jgi:regulator of nucleoside diphosphate kinase
MEINTDNQLTIKKNDYDTLMHYLKTTSMDLNYDRVQAEKLTEEVKTARVVNKTEFPKDMIGLNSKVTIRNSTTRQNQEYTLVLPGKVNHKNDKVSVLAPLGAALFGVCKGDTIALPSAAGKRFYTIIAVTNPVE